MPLSGVDADLCEGQICPLARGIYFKFSNFRFGVRRSIRLTPCLLPEVRGDLAQYATLKSLEIPWDQSPYSYFLHFQIYDSLLLRIMS